MPAFVAGNHHLKMRKTLFTILFISLLLLANSTVSRAQNVPARQKPAQAERKTPEISESQAVEIKQVPKAKKQAKPVAVKPGDIRIKPVKPKPIKGVGRIK